MNKLKILFFTFIMFFPFCVKAYGIENYYIDATVESSGDLLVQEYFNLTGDFNGFERIIEYANTSVYEFDPAMASFGGSSIHNGTGLEILEIRAVPVTSSFDFSNIGGDIFEKVYSASKGDYGVYTVDDENYGNRILMYNPSSYHKAFYIKYRILNMAIRHNDVGEIGWNIVGNALTESVGNLKGYLHFPGNTNIRVWGHGPLNGSVQIMNSETVYASIQNLSSYRAIDVRATFDLDVIKDSKKETNVNALDKIILYEINLANRNRLIQWVEVVLCIIILLVLGILVYRRYYSKLFFNHEYYRNIDDDYIPTTISYLFYKKINKRALSASVLDLIERKIVMVEKKGKNNYKLILNKEYNDTIPPVYEKLIKFIFNKRSSIETKDIKKYAKKARQSYHMNYSNYYNQCLEIAKQYEFYEQDIEKSKKKRIDNGKDSESKSKSKKGDILLLLLFSFLIPLLLILIYSLNVGFIFLVLFYICIIELILGSPTNDLKKLVFGIIYGDIILFCIYKLQDMAISNVYIWIYFMILIGAIASLIILRKTHKRTEKGILEYKKWKAIKRFLNDFGSFQDKEVMEVTLWEKYLVYATLFGCSKRILKAMRLKSIDDYSSISGDMYCDLQFSKCITDSIYSVYRVSSRSYGLSSGRSSSSGSGGDFSSGGGSFGGGGGGGRF